MAQNHDYADPQTTNTALNDIDQIRQNFEALVSAHSGSSAPSGGSIPTDGILWMDTGTSGDERLYIRVGSSFSGADKQVWPWTGKATTVSSSQNTTGEKNILVDTSSSAITVTLDTDDVDDGRTIVIKDKSSNANTNNITVDTEGSETIDGSASITINTADGFRKLLSDGSNWFVIASN